MQSKVASVWAWLRLDVFAYINLVGVDCKFGSEAADEGDSERQQLRIQERTCIGGASPQDQFIDEEDQRVELHRKRIQETSTDGRRRLGT